MSNPYIVIDRPGYYGATGRVYSSHATLEAANRAAKHHSFVDERGTRRNSAIVAWNPTGEYVKGSTFYGDMPPIPISE